MASGIDQIECELRQSYEALQTLKEDATQVELLDRTADCCVGALRRGNRILFAGNGGSAADAQHLAAELVGRFYVDRPGLAALALTTDSSMLTAIGNDYGFGYVFARQLDANGKRGDVFFALSTSGNSENVVNAAAACGSLGITAIGMTGRDGGRLGSICDICIRAPADSTPRIQELHTVMGHAICAAIEERLFRCGSDRTRRR